MKSCLINTVAAFLWANPGLERFQRHSYGKYQLNSLGEINMNRLLAIGRITTIVSALVFISNAAQSGSIAESGVTGGSQAHMNMQPSLAVSPIVALQGLYPSQTSFSTEGTVLGEVSLFAGDFALSGWAFAHGQLLDIAGHTALYSLLGTTYGGDGISTFALPDLRGRTSIHAGASAQIGWSMGAEDVTLSIAQMPAHKHAGATITDTGGSQAHMNMQPSLVLNHIIALWGTYPSGSGGGRSKDFIGEISLFAGDFAPGGWAFADGQLLDIAGHTALYSLLGTTYGGDRHIHVCPA